jgi:hypothetical protein
MPLDKIIRAGMEAKKMYDASQKGSDPVIPVPGRNTSGPTLPQPSNQSKANMAANMLQVPGRDVVRDTMPKRKKELDDL